MNSSGNELQMLMGTASDEEEAVRMSSAPFWNDVELNDDAVKTRRKPKKTVAKVKSKNGKKDDEGNDTYKVCVRNKKKDSKEGYEVITEVMTEEMIRSLPIGDAEMDLYKRDQELEELKETLLRAGNHRELKRLCSVGPSRRIGVGRGPSVVSTGVKEEEREKEEEEDDDKEEEEKEREEEEEEDSQISSSSRRAKKKKWPAVDDFIVPDGVIDPPRSRHRDESTSSMSEPKRRGRPPKDNKGTPSREEKKERKNRTPSYNSTRMEESEEDDSEHAMQKSKKIGRSPKKDNGMKAGRKKKIIESEESEAEMEEPSSRGRRSMKVEKANDNMKEKVVEPRRGRSAMGEKEKETDKKREANVKKKGKGREKEQSCEDDEDEVSKKRARIGPVTRGSSSKKRDEKKSPVKVAHLFTSEEDDDEEEEEERKPNKKKGDAKKRKLSEGKTKDEIVKKKERKTKKKSNWSEESEQSDGDDEDEEMEEEEEEDMTSSSTSQKGKGRGRPKKEKKQKDSGKIKTCKRGEEQSGHTSHLEIYKEKAKASKARKKKAHEKKAQEGVKEKIKAKNHAIYEKDRGRGILPPPPDGADMNEIVHHADEDYLYIPREGNRSPRPGSPIPAIRSRSVSRCASPDGSPERGDDHLDLRAHAELVTRRLEEVAEGDKNGKEKDPKMKALLKQMQDEERKEKKLRERREMERMKAAQANTPINPSELRIKPKVALHRPRDVGIISAASPTQSSTGPSRPSSSLGARGAGRGGRGARGGMRKTSLVSTAGSSSLSGPSLLDDITGEMDRSLPVAPSVTRTNNGAPRGSAVRTYIPAGRGVTQEMLNRNTEGGRRTDIVRMDSPSGRESREGRPFSPMDRPSTSSSVSRRSSQRTATPSYHPPRPHEEVTLTDSPPSHDQYNTMDDIATPASPHPVEEDDVFDMGDDDRLYVDRGAFEEEDEEVPMMDRLEEELHMEEVNEEEREARTKRVLRDMESYLKDGAFNEVLWALYYRQKTSKMSSFFDRVANRHVIFNLIENVESPPFQLRSALVHVDRWDRMYRDWRKRYEQCQFSERELHKDAPLSFVVLAKVTGERGRISEKISPLSVAVELNRVEWAEYLLQMGANVNERIVMADLGGQSFTGYIIQLAIEKMGCTSDTNIETRLDMIRLLLAFGANREIAIATLESMKNETIRTRGLSEEGFKQLVPSYSRYHDLVNSACVPVHVALYNSAINSTHRMFAEVFEVESVYEKVCTRPYEKFLNMQVMIHVRSWKYNPENCPVFAIVVGYSDENVLAEYKDVGSYKREMKKEFIHINNRLGEQPFAVYPLEAVPPGAPEPPMNRIAFESISEEWNIFIIPPHILHRLESVDVWIDEELVSPKQMVFGGLLRLRFKEGRHSLARVREELSHLRCSGQQFDGM